MDGIIVINKEKGYTSNDVVQIVKKIFSEKVGHTGTLDPMATGVLPLLVGKGTKCSKYLINHDKIYSATLKLGIKTDTGDITGNIIKKENFEEIKKEDVIETLNSFKGEVEQIPPIYSAIKVNGKKLYEYARNGQDVDIMPRKIKIYDIKLISLKNDEIQFKVHCSKGTYIRTLCENIAEKLKTVGTMSKLCRERVGEFDIKDSITIQQLKENFNYKDFIENHFITIDKLCEKEPKIVLNERAYISFVNGAKLFTDEINGIYRIYNINNVFIGTGIVNNGILKRDILIY